MTDIDTCHHFETEIIKRTQEAVTKSESEVALRLALHFNAMQVKYLIHELPQTMQDSLRHYLHSQKELNNPPSSLVSEEERQAYLQLLTFLLGRSAML
jgi:hypothetical protein